MYSRAVLVSFHVRFELCIVSHIWRVDLFTAPINFVGVVAAVMCGSCTSHSELCVLWQDPVTCCITRTAVGILFIFIIFCRLNDHKLH